MAKWEYYENASEAELDEEVSMLTDIVSENPCEICNKCADNEKTRSCRLAKRLHDVFESASIQVEDLDYCGG